MLQAGPPVQELFASTTCFRSVLPHGDEQASWHAELVARLMMLMRKCRDTQNISKHFVETVPQFF